MSRRPTSKLSRRGFLAGVGLTGAAGLVPLAGTSAAQPDTGRAAEVRSRSVLPSDRQGFNRRWYSPALQVVYTPVTSDEVVVCVQDALSKYGRDVKVVSGRHCYEGFVYNADTQAIIDMSGLCDAGYDPDRRAYFVDAGTENWSAYRSLLNGHGVTLPAGSCYSVGAGGHISGGGFGLLSRLHGLTIDHVTGIDVVTWDAATGTAHMRYVSESSPDADERDLFWALRGAGGGNYGAITRFWFADLPAAPAWASIWQGSWDWRQLNARAFARLVSNFAGLVADLPGHQFILFKLHHRAVGTVSMTLQIASGPATNLDRHLARAERAVRKLREDLGVRPSQHAMRHYPYLEAVQTLNGSGPNQFGKYKSAYINAAFSDDQIAALYDGLQTVPPHLTKQDMGQSLVQVDSYGGAINSVSPTATAVPHRSSIMSMQFQTYWDNRSAPGQASLGEAGRQQQAHLRWINDIYAATFAASGGTPNPVLDPAGIVGGCYYNYPDTDLGTVGDGRLEQALQLYFGANLRGQGRNLVTIKRRWDAQNYFHHPQSIPVE